MVVLGRRVLNRRSSCGHLVVGWGWPATQVARGRSISNVGGLGGEDSDVELSQGDDGGGDFVWDERGVERSTAFAGDEDGGVEDSC